MIAAIAACCVWSLSTWSSARGAKHLAGVSANLTRLSIALPILTTTALIAGTSPLVAAGGAGGWWFLISGAVGMGVCDILMLQSYARMGSRLPSLIVNAIAAPTAAVVGWAWLGERLDLPELAIIAVILGGTMLVLHPRDGDRTDLLGVLYAALAAITFGGSAVLSRVGYQAATLAGTSIHWLDATVIRVAAGWLVCALAFAALSGQGRRWRDGPGEWGKAVPWLGLNAVLGPSIGLVCYQLALSTTPAGIVQAVVAGVPALLLAATWASGEERPDRLAVLGTLIAVAGIAGLGLLRMT